MDFFELLKYFIAVQKSIYDVWEIDSVLDLVPKQNRLFIIQINNAFSSSLTQLYDLRPSYKCHPTRKCSAVQILTCYFLIPVNGPFIDPCPVLLDMSAVNFLTSNRYDMFIAQIFYCCSCCIG